MKTPIYNFVEKYANSDDVRFHMPGHKGIGDIEKYDITEIGGADSLYEADGIILESEKNAGELFSANTFYSAEGSSLSIRAMLYLALIYGKKRGLSPKVLAARNVHKSFVSAIGLLGIEAEWISSEKSVSYISSSIDASTVDMALKNMKKMPIAVYITSPDYLGVISPIAEIAEVCRKYGVLLLVDNAHGAYLKFLNSSMHPIDLGADICCDSAHKTLPVLTGGGYLHISKKAPGELSENAKDALALFGSTSPSYLILASLDRANEYISDGYSEKLSEFVLKVDALKQRLTDGGYSLYGNEPLKITLATKKYGYSGYEISVILNDNGVIPEFCDPDYLVLMLSLHNTDRDLECLLKALLSVPKKDKIVTVPPRLTRPKRALGVREAILSEKETILAKESLGRVLSAVTVGCPPAVPILVSGEAIDSACIEAFKYYGVDKVSVIK